MAEITAAMVREIRDRTGVAMMDCRNALAEATGDMDKAIDLLRKKGQAKQDKLATREAKEGRVAVAKSLDGRSAVIVEFNCNTDFAAKSALVQQLVDLAAKLLLANPNANVADDPQVKAAITATAQQTGENVRLGRYQVVLSNAGTLGTYAHYTGKVAVIVQITGTPTDQLVKDLCLHITAARPLALNRESVPAETVAKEKEIAVEQAKATGKPQNIADKIAEGKMRQFFQERVLLDQKFVKDDTKTITQLLAAAGCTLEKYARIEVGQ
ncbi:MAG: translation elongation factor Ts [Planctomycetota bacterium]|nr:translation elongation factor Ts [Planctomycetota bacterium]